MDSKVFIQKSEYSFKLLSAAWNGPVVIYISSDKFGESGENLEKMACSMTDVKHTFCELVVHDWDVSLTPWPADASLCGRAFKGEACKLLHSLEDDVKPILDEHCPNEKIYIVGYSLAGLFSLWSVYESELFDGVACCSGSVWYPEWIEYAQSHKLKKPSSVYLSLGKKEKNTKHPLMKMVEENMKKQYDLLQNGPYTERLHVDWHEGGHFSNTQERVAMGIKWLLD